MSGGFIPRRPTCPKERAAGHNATRPSTALTRSACRNRIDGVAVKRRRAPGSEGAVVTLEPGVGCTPDSREALKQAVGTFPEARSLAQGHLSLFGLPAGGHLETSRPPAPRLAVPHFAQRLGRSGPGSAGLQPSAGRWPANRGGRDARAPNGNAAPPTKWGTAKAFHRLYPYHPPGILVSPQLVSYNRGILRPKRREPTTGPSCIDSGEPSRLSRRRAVCLVARLGKGKAVAAQLERGHRGGPPVSR